MLTAQSGHEGQMTECKETAGHSAWHAVEQADCREEVRLAERLQGCEGGSLDI